MIIISSFGDKFCEGGKHIFTYLTRVRKAQKKSVFTEFSLVGFF